MPKYNRAVYYNIVILKKYLSKEVLDEVKAVKYRFKPGPKDFMKVAKTRKRDPGRVRCDSRDCNHRFRDRNDMHKHMANKHRDEITSEQYAEWRDKSVETEKCPGCKEEFSKRWMKHHLKVCPAAENS